MSSMVCQPIMVWFCMRVGDGAVGESEARVAAVAGQREFQIGDRPCETRFAGLERHSRCRPGIYAAASR